MSALSDYNNPKIKPTFIEIANTRPETMLGDVAIAVNPSDKRFKDLVGTNAILKIVVRKT